MGWLTPVNVLVLCLLGILAITLYQVGLDYYAKHYLKYDADRIRQICTYAKMGVWSCDDLHYAAPYCKSATDEVSNRCGQNYTVAILR
jgi:hypothetical protein